MSDNKTTANVELTNKILVVIVDDDKNFCDECSLAIEKTPDIKLATTTGSQSEAIESIKYYAPDVVILDLVLQDGGSGTSVLETIRSLEDSIQQPGVAIVTDNKNTKLLSYHTAVMGADTYYTKSLEFNGDEFVNKIRKTYDLICKSGVNILKKHSQPQRYRALSNVDKIRRLKMMISARLEKDGMFIGKGKGRMYLIDLIVLAIQNDGMENYVIKEQIQIVALKRNSTGQCVYRSVYSAIIRAYDFVTSPLYNSISASPFVYNNRHRTPFSVIAFYAEVFQDALD